MKRAAFVITAVLLWPLWVSAGENIYRCVEDGQTVYTDRACDDGEIVGEIRQFDAGASLAELERLIEQNRRFIERRQDRLAEARRARLEAVATAPSVIIVEPYHRSVVSPLGHIGYGRHRGFGKRIGKDAEPVMREQRFSALSGPFPGTRRSTSRAPAPTPPTRAARPRGAIAQPR